MRRIWGLFADDDPFTAAMQSDSFAAKASKFKRRELLPKIATIIHNRHSVYALRVVAAFQQLQEESARRMHAAHQIAREHQVDVFMNRGAPNYEQFNRLFTGVPCLLRAACMLHTLPAAATLAAASLPTRPACSEFRASTV